MHTDGDLCPLELKSPCLLCPRHRKECDLVGTLAVAPGVQPLETRLAQLCGADGPRFVDRICSRQIELQRITNALWDSGSCGGL